MDKLAYNKLRCRIFEKFGTQQTCAEALGWSNGSLSAKLNGRTEWTRQDIETVCKALDIPLEEAVAYFF